MMIRHHAAHHHAGQHAIAVITTTTMHHRGVAIGPDHLVAGVRGDGRVGATAAAAWEREREGEDTPQTKYTMTQT